MMTNWPSEIDRKFILCAKMFLLMLGRDPIEGLFFTKDLKIQCGPPANLAAAHKWWCLSERHHSLSLVFNVSSSFGFCRIIFRSNGIVTGFACASPKCSRAVQM